ncbi:MAG TPA: XylR family transcriptional regulator [Verrucomicrobiae bacterium]|nr:XylR family transcriptional regulator [Verrucomicrobiae bacterium]
MARIPKVLLLVESSRGSGRSLLGGIAHYTHHHGPWSCYWEPAGLEKAWPKLKTLDLDGIILRDVDKLEEVLAFGIPAVVIGHGRTEVSGLLNVVTDSARIGEMAADHLLACGFKRFAYCGCPASFEEDVPWSELRHEAFAARLHKAGCSSENFPIPPASSGSAWMRERSLMARWLQSLPKPIGLMAANDDRARQVVEACKIAGISIPSEVGIVGVDNDEVVCGLSDPPLSSVAVNFDRAGYEAASALDCLMNGGGNVPARIVVHPTHIVVRRSTDVVAVEDRSVAKALRYIRDALRFEELTVAIVARHSGISRRLLEKRFRRELGHSILDAIRRMRTDKIAQLLVETQLPVCEIAETLGFGDVQHFARYFCAVKKMSPLAYRKKFGGHASQQLRSQFGDSYTQSGVVARGLRPVKSHL